MTTEAGPVAFALEDAELIADASGALFWPAESTLIVADLHFEKGSSFARRGVFLPPYDTRATLQALSRAIARYRPRRVIALGDSFHDPHGAHRISPAEQATLSKLITGREWIWVLGNHDPAPPAGLGGTSVEELTLGALTFRHEPRAGVAPGEVAGHLHPCATVRGKGRSLRRRCFAVDGTRIVLPAFGAYTGGLCVLDEAFALVLRAPFLALVLGRERVYPVSHAKLRPSTT